MTSFSLYQIRKFRKKIYDYFKENKRVFPWRQTQDPYEILVSEVMLQQTQVARVVKKYEQFVKIFPSIADLADAQFLDVLRIWSGLGYNRRAKYLHEAAKIVVEKYSGEVPSDLKQLLQLPGVGVNTAGALCAYAFNKPVVFIETNIRSVFIHEFFDDKNDLHDNQILPLIEQTLDHKNPRKWYWALVDYGVHLKKTTANPSRKSTHHVRQTKFEGSNRQIRGKILKLLLLHTQMTYKDLVHTVDDHRGPAIIEELEREQMIVKSNRFYRIV